MLSFHSQFHVPFFVWRIRPPAPIFESFLGSGVGHPISPVPSVSLLPVPCCVSIPQSTPDFFSNPPTILCSFVNPLIFPITFCIILIIQFFHGFFSNLLISLDSFLAQLIFLIPFGINQFILFFLYSNEGHPISTVPISNAPTQRFFLCFSLDLRFFPDFFANLPIILYSSLNPQPSLSSSRTPTLTCSASTNLVFPSSALTAQTSVGFFPVHQATIIFLGFFLVLERTLGSVANRLIFLSIALYHPGFLYSFSIPQPFLDFFLILLSG